MQRADLIDQVRATMARAGFAVSERCDLRPVSFDLVARRDKVATLPRQPWSERGRATGRAGCARRPPSSRPTTRW